MSGKKKAKKAALLNGGEVRRNAEEEVQIESHWRVVGPGAPLAGHKKGSRYIEELVRLQFELIKLQEWVRIKGLRVVVLFEGRDAAGKGGVIKRIPRRSIRESVGSSRWRRRPSASAVSGISSATWRSCRPRAK
jgi:polyphosphate kinase 2 (PPK2 family)